MTRLARLHRPGWASLLRLHLHLARRRSSRRHRCRSARP